MIGRGRLETGADDAVIARAAAAEATDAPRLAKPASAAALADESARDRLRILTSRHACRMPPQPLLVSREQSSMPLCR